MSRTSPFALALALALLLALPAGRSSAAEPGASAPGPTASPGFPRFTLFPVVLPADTAAQEGKWSVDVAGERLFHRPGDPDSLFSLGGSGPSGEARLAAAVEVNEALLRATAPDPRVSASDPRGRLTGTYLPLDSAGRPYQFRLGARLVW